MDYRSILVDMDASSRTAGRIGFAAGLAIAQRAHLIGVTQTGIDRFIRESALPGIELGVLAPLFEQLRQDAGVRAGQFDLLVKQAGVASFEHRVGDDDPGNALATQAMCADLVIVSQRDPSGAGTTARDAAVPEYVAMNAPCPVMVLPWAGAHGFAFERVLVAWNASPEAARAVRQALPFLQQARQVEVAIAYGEGAGSSGAPAGGKDITLFLARHGVAAHVRQQPDSGDAAETLLSLAGEAGSQLLVMGCYGHSRFRELVLGGVSRTILSRMTLPILMAH
jgi:nucleotide-binding universal stress UspA family protein